MVNNRQTRQINPGDVEDALGATQGIVINDSIGFNVIEAEVNEEGIAYEYRLRLRGQPIADFPVEVRLPVGEIRFTDSTTRNRTYTFTTENWNEDRTISISAFNDPGANDNIYDITHHYGSGNVASRTLRLTVIDDEEPGIKEIILTGSFPEGVDQNTDDAVSYNVRLGGVPDDGAEVTVNIIVSPNSDGRITPSLSVLTFDGDNWDMNRAVTINVGPYASSGFNRFNIIHRAFGSIAGYAGVENRFILSINEPAPMDTGTVISLDPEELEQFIASSYNSTTMVASGGEYMYLASAYPFAGIDFELLSPESASATTTYQYLDASNSWQDFNLDEGSDFGFNKLEGTILWEPVTIGTSGTSWARNEPSSGDGLYYWVRIERNINTNKISSLRTASVASFKYFERGTEPWDWVEQGSISTNRSKVLGSKTADTWENSDGDIIEEYAPLHLQWRGTLSNTTIPITSYDIGDNDLEVVTRVIVHGRNGVKGSAKDAEREDELGIIKEKIITNAWELSTPAECNQHAELILSQYKPQELSGYQHGTITIHAYPSYKALDRRPVAIREGDMIRVSIEDGTFTGEDELINEPFLVLGIDFQENDSKFVLQVSRVLLPTPDITSMGENMLNSLAKKERSTAWNTNVPSESSATDNIFHMKQGIYDPTFRMTLDEEGRVRYDTFIGSDKNPSIKDNWHAHIAQDRNALIIGGEVCFDEEDNEGETALSRALGAFDDYGNPITPLAAGVITYDNETGTFRGRQKQGDPDTTLRNVAIGEWKTMPDAVPADGMVNISFASPYSNCPLVVTTVDASRMTADKLVSSFISDYIREGDNYTGVTVKVMAQSTTGTGDHIHSIDTSAIVVSPHTINIDAGDTDDSIVNIDVFTQLNIQTSKSSIVLDDDSDSTTYTVSLSEAPTSGDIVTVTLSGFDTDIITVEPTSLDFTSTSGQTVTVEAVEDIDDISDLTAIRHRLSHATDTTDDYVASDVNLSVYVIETPDIAIPVPVSGGITLSRTSMSLTEAGSSSTYDIRLSTRPNDGSTVRVFIDNPSDAIIISRTVLFFNDSDWDNNQRVTVRAVPDVDVVDETVRLRHTIISDGYDAPERILTVNVTDAGEVITPSMDVDGSINLSRSGTVEVDENSTFTYTVSLFPAPNAGNTVTVAIQSSDTSIATVIPTSLNFTSTSSQTVTVTGVDDNDTDDETTSIIHSISMGDYDADAEFFNVRVNDTDVAPIDPVGGSIILNRSTFITHEVDEGSFIDYTVRLGARPNEGDDITVTLSGYNSTVISLNTTSLTFDDNNWDDEQTIRVTGRTDTDTNNETTGITHSISETGYTAANRTLNFRVIDTTVEGESGSLVFDPVDASITLDEGDRVTRAYRVRLDPAPNAEVIILAEVSDDRALNFDNFGGGSTKLLRFPANSTNYFSVTLVALSDSDADDDFYDIYHNVDSGTYALSGQTTLSVAVNDDDLPPVFGSIVLSESRLEIDEETNDTYTINLSESPNPGNTVRVRISAASGDDNIIERITASGYVDTVGIPYPNGYITFNTSNWDNPRTVTVYAGEVDGNDFDRLVHHVEVVGYEASDEILDVDVIDTMDGEIVIQDGSSSTANPIIITPDIPEGGFYDYYVALSRQPIQNSTTVNIRVRFGDEDYITIDRTVATFNRNTYNSGQRVRVRSRADSVTSSQSVRIIHDIDDDSAYDADSVTFGLTVQNEVSGGIDFVAFSGDLIIDFNPSPTAAAIDEGHIGSYGVALTARPNSGDTIMVTVTVSNTSFAQIREYTGSDDLDGFGRTVELEFDRSNWSNGSQHRLEVRGLPRSSTSNGVTNINHTINTHPNYVGDARILRLTVTNTHINGSLVFTNLGSNLRLSIDVDAETTFGVRINNSPALGDSVHVSTEVTNGSIFRVNGILASSSSAQTHLNIVYTSNTFHLTNVFTIRGESVGTATIRFYVSSGDYFLTERTVTIIVGSPITVLGQILLNRNAVAIREDNSVEYNVALSEAPIGDVDVEISSNNSDIRIGSGSDSTQTIMLTTSNWEPGVDVTLNALSDSDSILNSATITHRITSGDYNASNVTMSAYVIDDEAAQASGRVLYNPSNVSFFTFAVGETRDVTVSLDTAPNTAVVIQLVLTTASVLDIISVRPQDEWLVFTPSILSRTVQLTGVIDRDPIGGATSHRSVQQTGSNTVDESLYDVLNTGGPGSGLFYQITS